MLFINSGPPVSLLMLFPVTLSVIFKKYVLSIKCYDFQ